MKNKLMGLSHDMNCVKNQSSIISILGRVGITIIALSIIYVFFGPLRYVEVEMINIVFFLFIVPPLLITGTILLSFLIGTPIRMIPKWFTWWNNRPYIALLLLIIGIFFCFLSIHPQFLKPHVVNSEGQIVQDSNLSILCVGWFLTSFSLLHFYFSSFIQFLKKKFASNKK